MYEIAGLRENCEEISFDCQGPKNMFRYDDATADLEGVTFEHRRIGKA